MIYPGSSKIQFIRKILVGARDPDEIINDIVCGAEVPYMLRWWVKEKETPTYDGTNIYLHCFLRSDYDRALHDHPRDSVSILLEGGYIEHMADGKRTRLEGDIVTRSADTPHRIELFKDRAYSTGDAFLPAWSLFLVGPKKREWGFLCEEGWTHWTKFNAANCGGNNG